MKNTETKCSVCKKPIQEGKVYKNLKYNDKDYPVCCPLCCEVFEAMPSTYSDESKPNIQYL